MTEIVRTSVSWVRQTFTWPSSWHSWQEAIAECTALAGAAILLLLTFFLPFWVSFGMWVAYLVTLAALQQTGFIKLFGPVLFYDMVTTARRGRYFFIRCLYALLLLLVLFWVWWLTAMRHQSPREESAAVAMHFFESFTIVQLIAVFLLTPAFVAGSVAEEKDRKTLEFLLATDLRNREIVLSKFGSRLCNLALFILTGLPILSFLQFLGGIDPDLVLASFAGTGLTALGIASISILQSVLYKRPRDAIAMTYLIVLAYLACATTLYILAQIPVWRWFFDTPLWPGDQAPEWVPNLHDLVDGFNSGNVIAALVQLSIAGSGRGPMAGSLGTVLPTVLRNYAICHGLICALCVTWGVFRLRALALKQTYGTTQKAGLRQKLRPPVGSQPMLWKEMNIEGALRINWVGWIAVTLLILLTVGSGLWVVSYYVWDFVANPVNWRGEFVEAMNVWVRFSAIGVGCLTLLAVAVRASTTIRNEMDRDTFDALIATPLSSDSILAAKFVGSLFSVRLGWLWLGSILTLGLFTGGLHPISLPLFLGTWVVFACLFTMFGLWYSMVCRTSMRATVCTLITAVGATVGHWLIWMCCGPLLWLAGNNGGHGDLPEYIMKFQFGLTPPMVMFVFSPPAGDVTFPMRNEFGEMFGFALLGLFLWSMASVMMWFVFIVPRFRAMTRRDQTSLGE